MTAVKTAYVSGRSLMALLGISGAISLVANNRENLKAAFPAWSLPLVQEQNGVIGTPDARRFAFVYIALVTMDAISGIVFPVKSMKVFFGLDVPPKSMMLASLQSLGGMAGSIVLTSLLALCSNLTDDKVALVGSMFMLLVAIWALVTNVQMMQYKSVLPLQVLTVLTFVALDAFGVISVNQPLKFLHGISIITGLLLFLSPSFAKLIYGFDIEKEGGFTTELYRCFCGYHVSACTLQLLLLSHFEVERAIGWTAAVTTLWAYEMCFLSASFEHFPKSRWLNDYTMGLALFLLAGLSAGMLC